MITYSYKGSLKNTEKFLNSMAKGDMFKDLDRLAKEGVAALASATPIDSGLAAQSWDYIIDRSNGRCVISWINTNVENGLPVVLLIQYGHGTGTGGYVEGRDFINPAIQPIFDRIAEQVWKVVTSA